MGALDRRVLKFVFPCYLNGVKSSQAVYIGSPRSDCENPIYYQQSIIENERGGSFPKEIIDSLNDLYKISIECGVSFQDLCKYALKAFSDDQAVLEADQQQSEA